MIVTYGYVGYKGEYYDLSNTIRGAKISAAKRGINEIYKRIGYNVHLISVKVNGVWTDAIDTNV